MTQDWTEPREGLLNTRHPPRTGSSVFTRGSQIGAYQCLGGAGYAGGSRAAISRRLAEQVVESDDVLGAVVGVFEELQTAPGRVVPIGELESIDRKEVSVEGTVETLWDPSHPSISQVGLIADDSGRTRVTVWKASDAPLMDEGEQVRIHKAAKNWYDGRVSLAVTGWSDIQFPERGRW